MIPNTRAAIEQVSKQGLVVNTGRTWTCVRCLGHAFDLYLYNNDASLTGAIANNGFWESWVTAWHVRNVGPEDVYVDIGANAGYYSFLADYLGAIVYAFEANPRYCELMASSSTLNGVKFPIEQVAVSDKSGPVRLNLFGDLDGSASIVGEGYDGKFMDVHSTRLDEYTFPAGQLVIKMDIEGAEELAWDGMVETLEYRKPTIIMEYTPKSYSETFWDKMRDYGHISLLDYEGNETLVTEKYADSLNDWCTLVIRAW